MDSLRQRLVSTQDVSLIQFVHTKRKSLKGSSPLDIVAFFKGNIIYNFPELHPEPR